MRNKTCNNCKFYHEEYHNILSVSCDMFDAKKFDIDYFCEQTANSESDELDIGCEYWEHKEK